MLYGLIGSVDGRHLVRGELPLDPGDPERTGRALADGLRARGGDALLGELRSLHDVPAPQPE